MTDSAQSWTLEVTFASSEVVPASGPGVLRGTPDPAVQVAFYTLGGASSVTRRLDVTLRNEHGTVILEPGRFLYQTAFQLELVPDTANRVVIDNWSTQPDNHTLSTQPDNHIFFWHTDSVAVAVGGETRPTTPLSPYSQMTASGFITFTELPPPDPLLPGVVWTPLVLPPVPYNFTFPGAPGHLAGGSSGSQTFNWAWFDHGPFAVIIAPTRRLVRYVVTGTIQDTFHNSYPVTELSPGDLSRTYQIVVAPSKLDLFWASHGSFITSLNFATANVLLLAFAAAGATNPYTYAAALILAALAGAAGLQATFFAAVAAGQQSAALDPPSADPDYAELYPFIDETGASLPTTKGFKNVRQFSIACGTLTRIYTAISKTEGKVMGARLAKDGAGIKRQQEYLRRLLQVTSTAAARMKSLEMGTVLDIQHMLNNKYGPITIKQMLEELERWSTEGIPANTESAWRSAGMSSGDVEIVRKRLAEPVLRSKVVDYAATIEFLTANLVSYADAVQSEAEVFL